MVKANNTSWPLGVRVIRARFRLRCNYAGCFYIAFEMPAPLIARGHYIVGRREFGFRAGNTIYRHFSRPIHAAATLSACQFPRSFGRLRRYARLLPLPFLRSCRSPAIIAVARQLPLASEDAQSISLLKPRCYWRTKLVYTQCTRAFAWRRWQHALSAITVPSQHDKVSSA